MKIYSLNKTTSYNNTTCIFYIIYTYANYYLPCLYDIKNIFINSSINKNKLKGFRVL